jgi:hypothetical protein
MNEGGVTINICLPLEKLAKIGVEQLRPWPACSAIAAPDAQAVPRATSIVGAATKPATPRRAPPATTNHWATAAVKAELIRMYPSEDPFFEHRGDPRVRWPATAGMVHHRCLRNPDCTEARQGAGSPSRLTGRDARPSAPSSRSLLSLPSSQRQARPCRDELLWRGRCVWARIASGMLGCSPSLQSEADRGCPLRRLARTS